MTKRKISKDSIFLASQFIFYLKNCLGENSTCPFDKLKVFCELNLTKRHVLTSSIDPCESAICEECTRNDFLIIIIIIIIITIIYFFRNGFSELFIYLFIYLLIRGGSQKYQVSI